MSYNPNPQTLQAPNEGFPKLGVPFLGVPIIRIIVIGGLLGSPILGKYQMSHSLNSLLGGLYRVQVLGSKLTIQGLKRCLL